jgi:SAM-dependent methyltransferase
MTKETEWAEGFFSGLFVEFWLRVPTEEQTRQEADFLQQHLRLTPGARVLDVACGGGRHACALAGRGFRATGVDASPEFLAAARALSARKGVDVAWEQRDMTDLPWPAEFDGAYCFGNSFGYYDDDANARFLRAVAAALKPGGRFAIDYGAVAEALLPNFQERMWVPFGDMHFLREARYDPARARYESDYTLIQGGRSEKKTAGQRVYLFRDLCRLMDESGFTEMQGFGSLTGDAFKLRSPRLLLTATRKGG